MAAIALFITATYTLSCIISDILAYSDIDKIKQEIYDYISKSYDNAEKIDKIVLSILIFGQVKTAVVAISIAYLLWQVIKFYFL